MEESEVCEHAVHENPENTCAKKKAMHVWKKERNIPHSEMELIFKVDSWSGEAIESEKTDEKVFLSHDKAVETAKICGISRREVFNIRKEVSADREGTADQEKKEKKVTGRREIYLDSFDQIALSRLILGFSPDFLQNPELPCINGSQNWALSARRGT